jgi:hypothetical protein
MPALSRTVTNQKETPMATKRKDESGEPRRDASGRELFAWEVDPADQAERPAQAETVGGSSGSQDSAPE